mmetsp:Transcript_21393/g.43986  ORF Transcript_21393/g.43986 Transcript_21393/m.43986 type:complete len:220 (+) Transcript_21393:214-873(+)
MPRRRVVRQFCIYCPFSFFLLLVFFASLSILLRLFFPTEMESSQPPPPPLAASSMTASSSAPTPLSIVTSPPFASPLRPRTIRSRTGCRSITFRSRYATPRITSLPFFLFSLPPLPLLSSSASSTSSVSIMTTSLIISQPESGRPHLLIHQSDHDRVVYGRTLSPPPLLLLLYHDAKVGASLNDTGTILAFTTSVVVLLLLVPSAVPTVRSRRMHLPDT